MNDSPSYWPNNGPMPRDLVRPFETLSEELRRERELALIAQLRDENLMLNTADKTS